MTTRFPLLVQFEFHPASEEAATAAAYLHEMLNADPAVPGLQVPTCFTPEDGSAEPPEPAVATEADRVVVVLLADDHLAVTARKPTKGGTTWGEYATKLRTLTEAAGHRFMPVQLTESAWPIDKRLDDTNFLRAWAIDGAEERHKFIARRLVHLLIRRLRPRTENEDAPPVTIFLSHTKMDLGHEPHVVKTLLAHLTATQPEKTWFDAGDLSTGSRFAHEIEKGVKDTALLAIVTDSYSSRSWCRKEVLFAKHYQRPVVIVDAVQEGETRRFPYSGNTPVIRWKAGDAQRVVDLLLREVLRHAYAEESLRQRKREGDVVLPAGPELVTIVHYRKEKDQPVVLYPDPPLGPEELEVLERTGVRVETPLQRHALAHDLRSRNLTVALSVSGAEDLGRYGLRAAHLDSILLDLSRYLLVAGVRLAYGGHLGPDGYTVRLADLLRDPIVEHLRGTSSTEQARPELVTYVPWPMLASVRDEARLGPLVEMLRCDRPTDIDESLDLGFVGTPHVEVPFDTALRRFAWSRGLTAMRERQANEVAARVVVGGKLGRPDNPYRGRMPGVLEEALLAIRTQRPLYLVGAFGGCARLVLDALDGIERTELTSSYHQSLPHTPELLKTTPVFDTYWRFASERQKMFMRRVLGNLPPWTEDPILRAHRFTNTYRASDRVSQYLIRHVIYEGLQKAEEVFFRTILFKLFNKIETWEALRKRLGALSWKEFSFDAYAKVLDGLLDDGERVYSAAYIMPSPAFGSPRKHRNHLRLIEHMMADGAPKKLARADSLRGAFELLRGYPSLGDFLAFQFAIDLNYSELTDFSEMEFVVAGPGARDGIRKCFKDTTCLTDAEIIQVMSERASDEFDRLGIKFQSLWGRSLQLIDCQNVFCEVSKYARVAHPDVEGESGRTRIKQKYRPRLAPVPQWYPPKWRIKVDVPAL